MEDRGSDQALPVEEVSMVEPEVVRQIRVLAEAGWGAKRIAREVGVARNTVRRYLRGGSGAETQTRPKARRLSEPVRIEARRLFDGPAGGNGVVVTRTLAEQGAEVGVRCVQRALGGHRMEVHAAQVATVRFETAPGAQMQIDFGQKRVRIADVATVVHLLVAVLSYSRRIFVKAFSPSGARIGARGSPRRFATSAASRRRCSATILGRSCSGGIERPRP